MERVSGAVEVVYYSISGDMSRGIVEDVVFNIESATVDFAPKLPAEGFAVPHVDKAAGSEAQVGFGHYVCPMISRIAALAASVFD
jgi:hypothetical protein